MKNSCTAIAGVVAVIVATLSGTGPGRAETFSDQVLDEHNRARAQYGARPLQWNAALESATAQYARDCEFTLSDAQGRYGENLYASSNPNAGIKDAVDAWMAEAADYDYANPAFSATTGHFTQIVWKSTTQVVASIADCPAGTVLSQPGRFVVVRYTAPGNVSGQFAQNVGRPSSS